jgi:hypothetical protein
LCQDNNLFLNVTKTKEMIVDYKKRRAKRTPIPFNRAVVKLVKSFKFLGVHITNKLSWRKYTKKVETEKMWHESPDPQNVLQLHHREHPDRLHHRLVWQLLGI